MGQWENWQKVNVGNSARLGAGGNAKAPQWVSRWSARLPSGMQRDLGRFLLVFGPIQERLVYSAIWVPSRWSWLIEEAILNGFLAAALEDLVPVLWFLHRRYLQTNFGPVRREREAIKHLVHDSYNIFTNQIRE